MANEAGRVAVVTGAGRGIGRAIAIEQAERGATVVLVSRTDSELRETKTRIEATGGKADVMALDVSDRAAVEAAFEQVARRHGAIDLLVNNHGSFHAFGPIWECDPAEWWGDVEINLRGTFLTCRAAVPGMRDRGAGRIVNLVGGGTGTSFPHGSGYASGKAAIMRFTECLNDTTKNAGVFAFAVDPGLVRTAMTEMQLESAAGQKYLGDIPKLFEQGADVPPTRAATLIGDIAEGRFDPLNGRLLRAADDRNALEAHMDAIVAGGGRALRFSSVAGDDLG